MSLPHGPDCQSLPDPRGVADVTAVRAAAAAR